MSAPPAQTCRYVGKRVGDQGGWGQKNGNCGKTAGNMLSTTVGMMDHPDLPGGQLNRIVACVAGVSVALLCSGALAGWLFHVDALKCIVPGAMPLKPNIAAGMLLCGVGLSLLSNRKIDRWIHFPIALLALLVITLAVLTLGEIFFGWDLGIDQLLFRTGSPEASASQRMFPTTAFCFLLAGGAILAAVGLHR